MDATLNKADDKMAIPVGLAECFDMDRDLSRVASIKLNDLPMHFIQKTLHCIDLPKLLRLRRVCSQWRTMITTSAVSGHIGFDITEMRKRFKTLELKEHLVKYNIWQYAAAASTIVFYESAPDYSLSPLFSYPQHVLLCAFVGQAINEDRTRIVNKVIFVNAVLSMEFLLEILQLPIKFQLVLYRSSIKMWTADLIDFTEHVPWDHFEWNEPLEESTLSVKLGSDDWFTLTSSHRHFINTQKDGNRTLDRVLQVIIDNASSLTEKEVQDLDVAVKDFPYPDDLLYILEYLLQRYAPKSGQALEYYIMGDFDKFAAVCHPLTLVLLRHFLRTVEQFLTQHEGDSHSEDCCCSECCVSQADDDDKWENCTGDGDSHGDVDVT
ncbi:hypothetical protein RvY_12532 [Ramazzottius varieornatus]|uniref:F-box domain-containing protein n=1 Tax=Ramazzottius varieornatus TaxID=947166 RepID=A0A1D1VSF8_RAMVA|nr:hypothetical protein RvY_12532 [Ramazzottius varieornatus]